MTTPLIILTIILFVLQSLSLKLVKADTLAEKLLSNCYLPPFWQERHACSSPSKGASALLPCSAADCLDSAFP